MKNRGWTASFDHSLLTTPLAYHHSFIYFLLHKNSFNVRVVSDLLFSEVRIIHIVKYHNNMYPCTYSTPLHYLPSISFRAPSQKTGQFSTHKQTITDKIQRCQIGAVVHVLTKTNSTVEKEINSMFIYIMLCGSYSNISYKRNWLSLHSCQQDCGM
jgi:hypothetical protein